MLLYWELLLLKQLQGGGEIAVALVEGLHGVKQLVGYLAGELARQVAELGGVVDIVIEHILQQGRSLLTADRLAMGMAVVMGVLVDMVVGMFVGMLMDVFVGMLVAVNVMLVVKMCHTDSSKLIDINLTKYTITQFCQVCKG